MLILSHLSCGKQMTSEGISEVSVIVQFMHKE